MVGERSLNSRRLHFIATGGAAIATVAVRSRTDAAQFEFKCGSDNSADHPSSVRLTQMWQAIERESGGRVVTRFFPGSQLGGSSAMFSQLRVGALQFQLVSPGNMAAVVPVSDVCLLGFTFRDPEEAQHVIDGPLGEYIRGEATAKGLHVMRTMWDNGMVQIGAGSGARPIRTPDDLHGFKIRVMESRISVDLFKDLGATPTPISLNEVYTAMQTHLVDGEASPLVSIQAARFYEVLKYISLTNHAWSGQWLIANADVWKALPPDLQAIVERKNTSFAAAERRDARAAAVALAGQFARRGLSLNRVDPARFRALLRPYYQFWANAFGPTAWGALQGSLSLKLPA